MLRHSHSVRVRYHECDPQGVMFNSHYLALFDMTLTEMWRAAVGGYQQMVDAGTDVVVGEAHVVYQSPMRFDEIVDITIEVAELGTTSMRTEYAITRDGDPVATGWLRHVFVDARTMGKKPIPEDIRTALSAEIGRASCRERV